ncbi:hypothetical protein QJQ45_004546 [Haematococcus lacustris]|nr:hypothetical protein QJQ45_004546 [Haematococcus lacustris]
MPIAVIRVHCTGERNFGTHAPAVSSRLSGEPRVIAGERRVTFPMKVLKCVLTTLLFPILLPFYVLCFVVKTVAGSIPPIPQAKRCNEQCNASEPVPSTPPPAKRSKRTKAEPEAAEPTQSTKAAKAKPAPQPGRWLDRDCNSALNMQRTGESRWRPLQLCYWPEQGALPAKGKEYPGMGHKRLRDEPPKAQQQPAEAQQCVAPTLSCHRPSSLTAGGLSGVSHIIIIISSQSVHDVHANSTQ